jgi:general secretion pathway protein D
VIVDGIPGLSDIPGLGKLFTHSKTEAQETDILLTLTPHVVRVLDLSEADLRPFKVRSGPATPLVEAPGAEPPPRDQPPVFQRPQAPAPGQQPVLPITPPAPAPQEPPPPEPPPDQTPP